jgi:dihydrofolate reductase
MQLAMIAALTSQHVIGKDGRLPWHLPADLAHFKRTTLHKAIIMGRHTFASLGQKPLPQRYNIVLSAHLPEPAPGSAYVVARNVVEAISLAQAYGGAEVMVIGGAAVYQAFLPYVTRLYLSWVHAEYPGDVFFPHYAKEAWQVVNEEVYADFTVQILQKKLQ